MIRQPTPPDVALAWHAAAVAGQSPPRHDSEPQPGFYMLRHVKKGPFVPAIIRIEADVCPETGELTGPERIVAEVNGWPEDAEKIWLSCRPITEREYQALVEIHFAERVMSDDRKALDLSDNPIGPAGAN